MRCLLLDKSKEKLAQDLLHAGLVVELISVTEALSSLEMGNADPILLIIDLDNPRAQRLLAVLNKLALQICTSIVLLRDFESNFNYTNNYPAIKSLQLNTINKRLRHYVA